MLAGLVLLVLLAGALAWILARPLAQWGLSRALGHPVSITGRFQPYLLPAPGFSAAGLRARHAALTRRATLLPDQDFELAQLTSMDARVRYVPERVDTKLVPLERLQLRLTISARGLALAPLSATLAGGRALGQLRLTRAPSAHAPHGAFQITIEDVRLGRLLAKLGSDIDASGRIDGHGAFVTSGASWQPCCPRWTAACACP